jgi:hypothetical protein
MRSDFSVLKFLKVYALYALLAFPLFYFVYKFGNPFIWMLDYYDYYKLYKDYDYHVADSPFNTRLLGSFFVHLIYKIGWFYHTETQIDSYPFEKAIFFSAVFFNYLCVCLSSVIIYATVRSEKSTALVAFAAGLLYLLNFGTLFFHLMPITDAFSVTIFAAMFMLYLRKSWWIILLCLAVVIQREYILLAFVLISFVDYLRKRNPYFLTVLITCVVCTALYFLLRKLIFETPKFAHQTSFDSKLNASNWFDFPIADFFRQMVVSMNLILLYFAVVAYKIFRKMQVNRREILITLLLIFQVIILAGGLEMGNNGARILNMLTPMFIFFIAGEVKPLLAEDPIVLARGNT